MLTPSLTFVDDACTSPVTTRCVSAGSGSPVAVPQFDLLAAYRPEAGSSLAEVGGVHRSWQRGKQAQKRWSMLKASWLDSPFTSSAESSTESSVTPDHEGCSMRITVTPDGRSSPNSPTLFDAKYLLGKYLRDSGPLFVKSPSLRKPLQSPVMDSDGEPTTHSGKQIGVVHSLLSSFDKTEDIAAGIRAAVLGTRGKSDTRFTERGARLSATKTSASRSRSSTSGVGDVLRSAILFESPFGPLKERLRRGRKGASATANSAPPQHALRFKQQTVSPLSPSVGLDLPVHLRTSCFDPTSTGSCEASESGTIVGKGVPRRANLGQFASRNQSMTREGSSRRATRPPSNDNHKCIPAFPDASAGCSNGEEQPKFGSISGIACPREELLGRKRGQCTRLCQQPSVACTEIKQNTRYLITTRIHVQGPTSQNGAEKRPDHTSTDSSRQLPRPNRPWSLQRPRTTRTSALRQKQSHAARYQRQTETINKDTLLQPIIHATTRAVSRIVGTGSLHRSQDLPLQTEAPSPHSQSLPTLPESSKPSARAQQRPPRVSAAEMPHERNCIQLSQDVEHAPTKRGQPRVGFTNSNASSTRVVAGGRPREPPPLHKVAEGQQCTTEAVVETEQSVKTKIRNTTGKPSRTYASTEGNTMVIGEMKAAACRVLGRWIARILRRKLLEFGREFISFCQRKKLELLRHQRQEMLIKQATQDPRQRLRQILGDNVAPSSPVRVSPGHPHSAQAPPTSLPVPAPMEGKDTSVESPPNLAATPPAIPDSSDLVCFSHRLGRPSSVSPCMSTSPPHHIFTKRCNAESNGNATCRMIRSSQVVLDTADGEAREPGASCNIGSDGDGIDPARQTRVQPKPDFAPSGATCNRLSENSSESEMYLSALPPSSSAQFTNRYFSGESTAVSASFHSLETVSQSNCVAVSPAARNTETVLQETNEGRRSITLTSAPTSPPSPLLHPLVPASLEIVSSWAVDCITSELSAATLASAEASMPLRLAFCEDGVTPQMSESSAVPKDAGDGAILGSCSVPKNNTPEVSAAPSVSECSVRISPQHPVLEENEQQHLHKESDAAYRCDGQPTLAGVLDSMNGTDIRNIQHAFTSPYEPSDGRPDQLTSASPCASSTVCKWLSLEQAANKRMKTSLSAPVIRTLTLERETEATSSTRSLRSVGYEGPFKQAYLNVSTDTGKVTVTGFESPHDCTVDEGSPVYDQLAVRSSSTPSRPQKDKALDKNEGTVEEGSLQVSPRGICECAAHEKGKRSGEQSPYRPAPSAVTTTVLVEVGAVLAQAHAAVRDADAAADSLLEDSSAGSACIPCDRLEESGASHDTKKKQSIHLTFTGCGDSHKPASKSDSTKKSNIRCQPPHAMQLHNAEDSLWRPLPCSKEPSRTTADAASYDGACIPQGSLSKPELDTAVACCCAAVSSVVMKPPLTKASSSLYYQKQNSSFSLPETRSIPQSDSQLLGPSGQSPAEASPMEGKPFRRYLPPGSSSTPFPDSSTPGVADDSCTLDSSWENASITAAGKIAECKMSSSGQFQTEGGGLRSDSRSSAASFLSILEDELFCARALAQLRHNTSLSPHEFMNERTQPVALELLRTGFSAPKRPFDNSPCSSAYATRKPVHSGKSCVHKMPKTEEKATPGREGKVLQRHEIGETPEKAQSASMTTPFSQPCGRAHNFANSFDSILCPPCAAQTQQESFAGRSESLESLSQLPISCQIHVAAESKPSHLQQSATLFSLSPPCDKLSSLPTLCAPCTDHRCCPNASKNCSASVSKSPTHETHRELRPAAGRLPISPTGKHTSPRAPVAPHIQITVPREPSPQTASVDQPVPDQQKTELRATVEITRKALLSAARQSAALCCIPSSVSHDSETPSIEGSSREDAESASLLEQNILTDTTIARKLCVLDIMSNAQPAVCQYNDRPVQRDTNGPASRPPVPAVTVCAFEEQCTTGKRDLATGVTTIATLPTHSRTAESEAERRTSATQAQPMVYHPWVNNTALLCSLKVFGCETGSRNHSSETFGEPHLGERLEDIPPRSRGQNIHAMLCSEGARRSVYRPKMSSGHLMLRLKPGSFDASTCSAASAEALSARSNAGEKHLVYPVAGRRSGQRKPETSLSSKQAMINFYSPRFLDRIVSRNPATGLVSGSPKRSQLPELRESTRKPTHSYMFVVRMQARAEERRQRLAQLKLRKAEALARHKELEKKAKRVLLQEQQEREKQRQQEDAAASAEARRQQQQLRTRALTYRKRRLTGAALEALCIAKEATRVTVNEAKSILSGFLARRTIKCWRLTVVRRRCMDVAVSLARDDLARQWIRKRSHALKALAFCDWASNTVAERERSQEILQKIRVSRCRRAFLAFTENVVLFAKAQYEPATKHYEYLLSRRFFRNWRQQRRHQQECREMKALKAELWRRARRLLEDSEPSV